MTALSRGETPGPEASIGKLVSANKLQEIAAYGIDLLGTAGVVIGRRADAARRRCSRRRCSIAPGLRIAGGTDEILRNIIAERVLGLPPDMRADKDVAFKDIPTGGRP